MAKKKLKLFSLALMALFTTSLWAEKVTWTPTNADVTSLTSNTKSLVVGSGTQTFTVYAIRNGNTPALAWSNSAFKFNDNAFYKSGISIYIPSTCDNVTSITFYLKNSNSKVIYYKALDAQTISSNPSDLPSLNLTSSYVGYTPFSSPTKGVYYAIGGKASSSGGDTYLQKVEVVFADAPAATYTVTIDPNSGSYASTPTGWTLTDGKYTKSGLSGSFNVPEGLAYSGYDLTGWKDGQGNTITLPITLSKDTTLVAQWVEHTQSSDATLAALSVAGCTLNETFAPATTAYTIDLPFYASMPTVSDVTATKNDPYASNPVVSIDGNVISVEVTPESGAKDKKTYTITVNFAPVPTASSSINIEQNILDNTKKWDVVSALTAANIVTDGRNGLDSINESKDYRNYAFWGLKLKKNDADILKVIVPAGKVLNIKIGSIGAAVNVLINGEAYTTIPADKDKINHFFHLDATANPREVIFHTTANETTTLQQVKIGEDCDDFTLPALYTVTYNAGAGSCETATDSVEFANDQITLPEVTPATGYGFDGWYNAATEGTKVGDAGDNITLTKDSTLYAHYSIIDYTITCATGLANGSVSAKATANYGEVVTLSNTPAEGYELNAYKVYKTGDEETVVTVTEGKFTMPAYAVTVTATFKATGEATSLTNTATEAKTVKRLENGMLVIEKDGKTYNVMGQAIR